MKFNPYAALLMTGTLMMVTVVFAQVGTSASLLKAGAVSVDRDFSRFAARTVTAIHRRSVSSDVDRESLSDADRESRIRVASIDKQSKEPSSPN